MKILNVLEFMNDEFKEEYMTEVARENPECDRDVTGLSPSFAISCMFLWDASLAGHKYWEDAHYLLGNALFSDVMVSGGYEGIAPNIWLAAVDEDRPLTYLTPTADLEGSLEFFAEAREKGAEICGYFKDGYLYSKEVGGELECIGKLVLGGDKDSIVFVTQNGVKFSFVEA